MSRLASDWRSEIWDSRTATLEVSRYQVTVGLARREGTNRPAFSLPLRTDSISALSFSFRRSTSATRLLARSRSSVIRSASANRDTVSWSASGATEPRVSALAVVGEGQVLADLVVDCGRRAWLDSNRWWSVTRGAGSVRPSPDVVGPSPCDGT